MPNTIASCDPPGPDGVRSNDELVERLRLLRAWAGVSLRELHRRVIKRRRARGVVELPSLDTVHRCLRTGRTRLDADLVVDIAAVLLGGKGRVTGWRQAVQVAAGHKSEATAVVVSDALPDDAGRFVGRSSELRRIMAAVTRPGSGRGRRPVAAVVDGMPGVGKTTLTVRAAHRLARDRRFEHVLWVNLRGHDPDRPPADPAAVLDGFLRRLGIPGSKLAGLDRDRLAAAYRDLLTRRQVLVVLDNAAGDEQIRPLLAYGPGSVTLVTSRRRLTEIPAGRRVALGVFERSESVRMLGDILGPKRIDAEPAAAAGVAAAVGDLPLGNAGSVCSILGRHDDAIRMLRRALLLDSRHDNPVGEAYTCGNLGAAYGRRGEHDEALVYFTRSLAVAREVGSTDIEVLALTNLGSACTLQGRYAEALEHNRQALRIADEAAAHSRMPVLHEGIAAALRALGDYEAAAAHHGEALRIATEVDDHFERARAHEGLARCAVAAGRDGEARQHRAAVRSLLAELGVEEVPPELRPPEDEEGVAC